MKQALKIILASALVTGFAIKAAPALAQDPVNVSIVRTADLDLSSASGQRVLQQRLAVAAHTVCDGASAVDLKAQNAEAKCRDQVMAAGFARAEAIAAESSGKPILLASGN